MNCFLKKIKNIFVVSDIAIAYELINLQVNSIYINGYAIQQTISYSYSSDQ